MNDLRNYGWVRFYRKSINSSVWYSPTVWMVWSWCLLKANHVANSFPFNGSDIEILPGQFVTGRKRATKEMPISEQQYRTALKYLENTKRLTIQSTNHFSLITVEKWEEYQNDNQQTNQPLTSQQPATNQSLTTNKNDKNDKNDKNYILRKVKNNEIIPLKDGTKAKLYFGTWVDAKDNAIKINTAYYPELKQYDIG